MEFLAEIFSWLYKERDSDLGEHSYEADASQLVLALTCELLLKIALKDKHAKYRINILSQIF